MARIAVFAYGSLANAESAARTLGRSPQPELRLAQLRGWRRRWSQARDNRASEKTFARADDGSIPGHVLGLNIERIDDVVSHSDTNASIAANGVLISVSEEELTRLDLREIRYDRTDVTAEIASLDAQSSQTEYDQIITYTARPGNYAPDPPPNAVILAPYFVAVEAAFASLGQDQLDLYRETTDPPPVEVVDATLVRDQIPPGNPRAW